MGGGQKNLDFLLKFEYFLSSKTRFLCFCGVLGTFNFWVKGGGIGRVVIGGTKLDIFLDFFWGPIPIACCVKMRCK